MSVIIPTFNRPHLVQQAVESVLAQQGPFRFEIIVIDDGSTPDTEQGLRRFGSAIRYVRQDNAGLNPARNHGLRLATSEYVALLDDDDVWLPFKTAVMMAALQRFPQAGFVHSNFHIWKPDSDQRRADGLRSWFPRAFSWDEMYDQREEVALGDHRAAGFQSETVTAHFGDVYYWSLFAPMVLPSTAIVRRDALEAGAKFPEVDSVGDWEFFARLSQRRGGVFVPAETTLNRSHEDAVRLTRVDPRLRLQRRIGLIHRLWRADGDFMRERGAEVDRVEAECLRKLARLAIAAGDSRAARAHLSRLRALRRQSVPSDHLLWGLSCIPFAGAAVGVLRSLRSRASPARRART